MEETDLWYCEEKPAVDEEGNPTGGVVKEYPNIPVVVVENEGE